MAPSTSNQSQQKHPSSVKIRLPHPYLTTYHLHLAPTPPPTDDSRTYFLRQDEQAVDEGEPFPAVLHDESILFTELGLTSDVIDEADNTEWARARRSPSWCIDWTASAATPTLGHVWLFLYAFFTMHHDVETFRLRLQGQGAADVTEQLLQSMVAMQHPQRINSNKTLSKSNDDSNNDELLLILRSAFWQGCASPLGARPVWLPTWPSAQAVPHLDYTIDATQTTFLRHPRRRPKPTPGALLYSRYIPSLDEHFSLTALDYRNPQHLDLFHRWQNDPRVAQGWRESGSLDHHRAYLADLHRDPHVITVLGSFNDVPFAYFEIYWAKEDRMGMHYAAGDFDRGRHSLVGEDAFRGTHRVMAWWPSVMHYIFLDDHRTENVVGEPRLTGAKVLMYEYMFGLHQDQWIDLPHKRSNLVKCSRERFFQICPFEQHTKHIAGTTFTFPSRL
ncbi:hypothetical protein E4U13_003252 [Claviceps humidiphila]|uniref:Acyltransferase MbtK/IucB-like conserved domain-containing protein n=1 Tax=Claviceps humidiphila TaxID=1294629 RepID=A0A9P7PZW7_9HYPO|nr:hypothetical protein E4U13_003252 [Claviceps humidiphila]